MKSSFLNRFQRVTYSTSYLPEIDGLRFLAIFSVVVIMHTTHYIDDSFFNGQLLPSAYWKNFVMEGGAGVPLFFILSGFILSLPFARCRLKNSGSISLKNYYLRRLTRLEPPYLIVLLILFSAQVWLLDMYGFSELFPHLLASATYTHYFFYGNISWVLPIAWSLEVEVQFYILAPVFFMLFTIPNARIRWLIYTIVIITSVIIWYDVWGKIHLLAFLHYFFTGIFLADLYCSGSKIFRNESLGLAAGILSLAGFLFLPGINYLPGYILKLICMFLLIHTVLTNHAMKKLFSIKPLIIIGGMCYSIYLLHFAILSATGHLMMYLGLHLDGIASAIISGIFMVIIILIISAGFYLLVEKPFMRYKGFSRFRNQTRPASGLKS